MSILLNVDDLLIIRADMDEISLVKSKLAPSFEMNDLTDLPWDRSDPHP